MSESSLKHSVITDGKKEFLKKKKCKVCGTNVFAEVIPNLIPGKAFPKK